jgi:Nif-specific regulatory protein
LCDGHAIRGTHLPPTLQFAEPVPASKKGWGLEQAVEQMEQEMIIQALKKHTGNQRRAATELGITERILGYKIKNFDISPKFYTAKAL